MGVVFAFTASSVLSLNLLLTLSSRTMIMRKVDKLTKDRTNFLFVDLFGTFFKTFSFSFLSFLIFLWVFVDLFYMFFSFLLFRANK